MVHPSGLTIGGCILIHLIPDPPIAPRHSWALSRCWECNINSWIHRKSTLLDILRAHFFSPSAVQIILRLDILFRWATLSSTFILSTSAMFSQALYYAAFMLATSSWMPASVLSAPVSEIQSRAQLPKPGVNQIGGKWIHATYLCLFHRSDIWCSLSERLFSFRVMLRGLVVRCIKTPI